MVGVNVAPIVRVSADQDGNTVIEAHHQFRLVSPLSGEVEKGSELICSSTGTG